MISHSVAMIFCLSYLVHPNVEFMHDEIPTDLFVTQFQGDLSDASQRLERLERFDRLDRCDDSERQEDGRLETGATKKSLSCWKVT